MPIPAKAPQGPEAPARGVDYLLGTPYGFGAPLARNDFIACSPKFAISLSQLAYPPACATARETGSAQCSRPEVERDLALHIAPVVYSFASSTHDETAPAAEDKVRLLAEHGSASKSDALSS